jgi:hypothetical protein
MIPTAEDYAKAFECERQKVYPTIDAFETRCGYAVDLTRLEAAARVLACPVKAHAPNWQHGRVLYAMTRQYLETSYVVFVNILDIGTAKGFSALCLQWALADAYTNGLVSSVDVIDPAGLVRRNTVAEVGGYLTLFETLAPWPEAEEIKFYRQAGEQWLARSDARVHVAFIDGKHTGAVVAHEAALLAERQRPGDLVLFDDAQIQDVGKAIAAVKGYALERLAAIPGEREYVLGVRQ